MKIFSQVFYKNQEPGELLNNLQRCSAKFLQLHAEKECCDIKTNLKLFSAFIYFSSPTQRTKFRKDIEKFVDKYENIETLTVLKRILSYVKISDRDICERFWNASLNLFNTNKFSDICHMCYNYTSFNTDVPDYRNLQFEKKALEHIDRALKNNELFFASGLSALLAFCLRYDPKGKIITMLIDKLGENVYHIKPNHYMRIVDSLEKIDSSALTKENLRKLQNLLKDIQAKFTQAESINPDHNTFVIKTMIMQNQMNEDIFETMLYKFKELEYMSSKFIENLCNIFQLSSSVVPEVLNKCTEYVVNNPENVVGFNIEKLMYLCYNLAYLPLNDKKFFQTATDIIIRYA